MCCWQARLVRVWFRWRRIRWHFTRLMTLGGWENWMLLVNHLAATALTGFGDADNGFRALVSRDPELSIDH